MGEGSASFCPRKDTWSRKEEIRPGGWQPPSELVRVQDALSEEDGFKRRDSEQHRLLNLRAPVPGRVQGEKSGEYQRDQELPHPLSLGSYFTEGLSARSANIRAPSPGSPDGLSRAQSVPRKCLLQSSQCLAFLFCFCFFSAE